MEMDERHVCPEVKGGAKRMSVRVRCHPSFPCLPSSYTVLGQPRGSAAERLLRKNVLLQGRLAFVSFFLGDFCKTAAVSSYVITAFRI